MGNPLKYITPSSVWATIGHTKYSDSKVFKLWDKETLVAAANKYNIIQYATCAIKFNCIIK